MDVTVVVATFGGDEWLDLARQRAVPSVIALRVPFLQIHGDTLHGARNMGLDLVETEFVCFLDADDELEAGYFDEMAKATADVRAPAVRYVRDAMVSNPLMPKVHGHEHDCGGECLPLGNWVVVGAVTKTDLAQKIGWDDWPMYEDWSFFLRCYQAGATFEAVPAAVYRAHVRGSSRNRGPDQAARLEAHRMIARANGVPVP